MIWYGRTIWFILIIWYDMVIIWGENTEMEIWHVAVTGWIPEETNQRCPWIDMEHQQPWVLLGGELPTNRFCGSYPSSFSGIRRVNLTHMFCFLMFPVNVPMEIYPIPVFTGCFLYSNKSWWPRTLSCVLWPFVPCHRHRLEDSMSQLFNLLRANIEHVWYQQFS